jgi:phosphate-selective porin OprO/OprP
MMSKNIYSKFKNALLTCTVGLLALTSGHTLAANNTDDSQQRVEDIQKEIHSTKGTGWHLKSQGGLKYIHAKDDSYWFALNGVMRFDEVLFSGSHRDRQGNFPSGGNVRKIEVDVEGGLGKYWVYTLGVDFGIGGTRTAMSDSWLGYEGLAENIGVYAGRHSANWFGYENSCSTSWYPFLERSLAANAFYPGDGVGVLGDMWWENSGFTVLALQPDHGPRVTGTRRAGNDRWLGAARYTFAPVHELGDVWHFGVSAAYRHSDTRLDGLNVSEFAYSTRPGGRARDTAQLVNTGSMVANHAHVANVEAARQYGPLLVQAEYTTVFVHRKNSSLSNVRFDGWNLMAQYMLTGEILRYDVRDGAFSKIDIQSPYGAVELAARYDGVNLNDKDLHGGSQKNATVGVNWYLNDNIKLSANYVHALVHPANGLLKRKLDIIGARVQVKFK